MKKILMIVCLKININLVYKIVDESSENKISIGFKIRPFFKNAV
jgi:hypothetical protein